ncbi:hypothetical protein BGZ74_001440 [Mortierella antarctica]|nr:hypothetical protein BGZ74_001440 [Mortierella antarctica]
MDNNTIKTVATVAAAGLGLAAVAIRASQRKLKTGRESWNPKTDLSEYDYIIAGGQFTTDWVPGLGPMSAVSNWYLVDTMAKTGGTAGCVLAARLTEKDPSVRVLILEAGEDMDNTWWTKVPFLITHVFDTKYEWCLKSIPQVHANNRVLKQVRGKVLGGSSSINAMSYTRGPKDDYNYWANEAGNPGWSYEEVLPYFKKSERFHDPALPADHPLGPRTGRVYQPEYDTFEPEYHGTEGLWKVSFHDFYNSSKGFIRAHKAMGTRRNPDHNGESMLDVCRTQTFIQPNGCRSSTSIAFLGDPKVVPGGGDRGTVRIVTKVHVERLLLEKRNGVQTAVGVVFRDERNVLYKVHAKREVLLCTGVFHTPVILLASGIGHQIHESIPVVHHLPGVGQNLSDHVGVGIVFEAPDECDTVHTHTSVKELAKAIYNYARRGTGILSSQFQETMSFHRLEDIAPDGYLARSASGPNAPHIELLITPGFVRTTMDRGTPKGNYYTISPVILNPASRGSVEATVRQSKGQDRVWFDPAIDPNIYSDPFDMRVMKEAIRFVRKFAKYMKVDPDLGGKECYPSEEAASSENDEGLEAAIRDGSASYFHACGHTCAPVVMVAEKAADMIREDNSKANAKEE